MQETPNQSTPLTIDQVYELLPSHSRDVVKGMLGKLKQNAQKSFEDNALRRKRTFFKNDVGQFFLVRDVALKSAANPAEQPDEVARELLEQAALRDYVYIVDRNETGQIAARDTNLKVRVIDKDYFAEAVRQLAKQKHTELDIHGVEEAYRWVKNYMRTTFSGQYSVRSRDIKTLLCADDPLASCWCRIPFKKQRRENAPPTAAEWLSRHSDPLVTPRFVGSLLDPTSSRKQYLYLHGYGNDGKSAFITLLTSIFQESFFLLPSSAVGGRDSHATEGLEGKRLIMINDAKGGNFVSSESFKTLTGDSHISINPKGTKRRIIELDAKFIVTSNDTPEIEGTRADKARLLYVYVNSYTGTDDNFVQRLISEAEPFLQYCWTMYEDWKAQHPNGGSMASNPDTVASIASDSPVAEADGLLDDLFTEGGGGTAFVSSREFKTLLKSRTHFDKDLFKLAWKRARARYQYKQKRIGTTPEWGFENVSPKLSITTPASTTTHQ